MFEVIIYLIVIVAAYLLGFFALSYGLSWLYMKLKGYVK